MFADCPLCGVQGANGQLEGHIVGHPRSLALVSLPPVYEDDDESTADNEQNMSSASLGKDQTMHLSSERIRSLSFESHREDPSLPWSYNSEPLSAAQLIDNEDYSSRFIRPSLFDGKTSWAEIRDFEWGFATLDEAQDTYQVATMESTRQHVLGDSQAPPAEQTELQRIWDKQMLATESHGREHKKTAVLLITFKDNDLFNLDDEVCTCPKMFNSNENHVDRFLGQ